MTFAPRVVACFLLIVGVAACTRDDTSARSAATAATVASSITAGGDAPRVLRVCADPNNLPFSDSAEGGFENRIAQVIARELGASVEYTWWAQRRGFVRNTLRANLCDVVMGIPSSYELLQPTRPYYRSTYVFVTRRDRRLHFTSLDDPQLRDLRIGVQMVGDDYSNTPPAHALARRGVVQNVRGHSVLGDYSQPHPASEIVSAVARGEVDVALVWGPLAGFFIGREPVPLEIAPVTPQIDTPFLPFVFDIALGVRREDTVLRGRLERILVDRRVEIDSILQAYGVPRVDRVRAAPGAGA